MLIIQLSHTFQFSPELNDFAIEMKQSKNKYHDLDNKHFMNKVLFVLITR